MEMFDGLKANQAIEVEYGRDVNGWARYDYFIYNPPVLSRLHGSKVYNTVLPDELLEVGPIRVSPITWEAAFKRSVVGDDGLNVTERERMARDYMETMTRPPGASTFKAWRDKKREEEAE